MANVTMFFRCLKIRSKAGAYCVDSKDDKTGTNVIGYQCHGQGGNQV